MRRRIYGIGVDVAFVPRFERVLRRHGDRFLRRAYHPEEIAECYRRDASERARFLASRWAVKEATFKAFQRFRVAFPDIRVAPQERLIEDDGSEETVMADMLRKAVTAIPVSAECRALSLVFSGKTAILADELGLQDPHLVSLSHDEDYATAFVVLQQVVPRSRLPHRSL